MKLKTSSRNRKLCITKLVGIYVSLMSKSKKHRRMKNKEISWNISRITELRVVLKLGLAAQLKVYIM